MCTLSKIINAIFDNILTTSSQNLNMLKLCDFELIPWLSLSAKEDNFFFHGNSYMFARRYKCLNNSFAMLSAINIINILLSAEWIIRI